MDNNFKAIKERAEKATAGPWEIKIENCDTSWYGTDEIVSIGPIASSFGFYSNECCDADSYLCLPGDDADFIAHARTDIPALLAEVERQTGLRLICALRSKRMTKERDELLATCKKAHKQLLDICAPLMDDDDTINPFLLQLGQTGGHLQIAIDKAEGTK